MSSSADIDHLGTGAVIRDDGTVPINVSVGNDGKVGLLVHGPRDSYAATLVSATETERVIEMLSKALITASN